MFGLLAVILSGVALVLTLVGNSVPAWILWAVLGLIAAHITFPWYLWRNRPLHRP